MFFLLLLSLWHVGVVSFIPSRMADIKTDINRVWMNSRSSSSSHSTAGFNLSRYLNENLINHKGGLSSTISVEFHSAASRTTFEENKHYLLLVDLGVRTIGDIDLPYITNHLPALKQLIRKIKSTGLCPQHSSQLICTFSHAYNKEFPLFSSFLNQIQCIFHSI